MLNEKELAKNIYEIRERLAEINTTQKYIVESLDVNNEQTQKALSIAYQSKDIAKKADDKADLAMERLTEYKKNRESRDKTIITAGLTVGGILVTVIIFLTPMVINFYVN